MAMINGSCPRCWDYGCSCSDDTTFMSRDDDTASVEPDPANLQKELEKMDMKYIELENAALKLRNALRAFSASWDSDLAKKVDEAAAEMDVVLDQS